MNIQDKLVDYKAMGQRIRMLRKEKKYTQEQAAEMVGVSCSYIGHIERGLKATSLETLARICKIFDTDMHYLVFGCSSSDSERGNAELRKDLRQLLKRHNLI